MELNYESRKRQDNIFRLYGQAQQMELSLMRKLSLKKKSGAQNWEAKKTLPREKGHVLSTKTRAELRKNSLLKKLCGWALKVGLSTAQNLL